MKISERAVHMAIALVCGSYALFTISGAFKAKSVYDEFVNKTSDGANAVYAINQYYVDTNSWPNTIEDIVPKYLANPPNEWTYISDADDGAPVLQRRGPFHMTLIYHFPKKYCDGVDGYWELREEGDSRKLNDVVQKLPACK